ncbi:Alkyltransferase-like protein 1, partial [Colletotrichum viniferum]
LSAAERPRQVGICLKHLPTDPSARFNNENVPWQRVINAKGAISPRSQPTGARSQADALRAEDVEVTQTAMGEFEVDFDSYGWFPDSLPSEEELTKGIRCMLAPQITSSQEKVYRMPPRLSFRLTTHDLRLPFLFVPRAIIRARRWSLLFVDDLCKMK